MPEKITTSQAAKLLGVTPGRVHHYVTAGRLTATTFGRDLAFDVAEVKNFQRLKRGPKPKSGKGLKKS